MSNELTSLKTCILESEIVPFINSIDFKFSVIPACPIRNIFSNGACPVVRLIENLSLFSEGFPTRFACGNDTLYAKTDFEMGSSNLLRVISRQLV